MNQHRFSHQEASDTEQTGKAVVATSVAPVDHLSSKEVEEDLLEFGVKAKEHLKVTHGVNHSFYSKLFAASDVANEQVKST